jgi:ribosomal protein L11 methyltransferase
MRTESMKETYLSIRCVIPAELEEELPELLAPWAVLGTEIGDSSDSGVRVAVFLHESDADDAESVNRVLKDRGAQDIEHELLEADDWLAEFREQIRPFEVGTQWWIDPHPDRPTAAPVGRRRLVVEPRMAFGTGTHESTRAILMELEELEVDGRRVLDVGTGSGILALAAESLGAEWVVGLDVDPAAVWVAFEIAHQQEWRSRVSFVLGSVDCLGGVAGELRNSLAPTSVAVFSGLLASEAESVFGKLTQAGFAITSRRDDGDWASLTATAAPMP